MTDWDTIASVGNVGVNAAAAYGSFKGQSDANLTNLRIAQRQMDFQKEMSNTSYQRTVKDMKLAGINPMLAYKQGGASSPGGATTKVADAIGPAISSAMAGKRLLAELQMMNEQKKNVKAQTVKATADAVKVGMDTSAMAQEITRRGYGMKRQGTPSHWMDATRLANELTTLQIEGLRADMPARRLRGNKYWAGGQDVTRSLFGPGGVVNPFTRLIPNVSRRDINFRTGRTR